MNTEWINSHLWRENIASPVNRTEMGEFQERLNRIVGTEPDGTSHLKLVWGQDLREDGMWDREGFWVPRHHWDTVYDQKANPLTGLIELEARYIGVPRYFILAYVPPVHITEADRAGGVDGETIFTPEMNDTLWTDFMAVEQHTPRRADGWRDCCEKAAELGVNCHGEYIPPNEKILKYIEACYQQWQQLEQRIDPNRPFNAGDHVARWREMTTKRAQERAAERKERGRELVEMAKVLDPKIVVPDMNFLR